MAPTRTSKMSVVGNSSHGHSFSPETDDCQRRQVRLLFSQPKETKTGDQTGEKRLPMHDVWQFTTLFEQQLLDYKLPNLQCPTSSSFSALHISFLIKKERNGKMSIVYSECQAYR